MKYFDTFKAGTKYKLVLENIYNPDSESPGKVKLGFYVRDTLISEVEKDIKLTTNTTGKAVFCVFVLIVFNRGFNCVKGINLTN